MATAEGIVHNKDSNLYWQKWWSHSDYQVLGKVSVDTDELCKKESHNKGKISNVNFEENKTQFVYDVKAIMELEEIPDYLVISWDHYGIHYIPVSNCTMEADGSKRVAIAGKDDKRQITAVLSVTMYGHFLPPQIIYKGTTKHLQRNHKKISSHC